MIHLLKHFVSVRSVRAAGRRAVDEPGGATSSAPAPAAAVRMQSF